MRRNPGYTLQIERRIFHIDKAVKLETQNLRNKWVIELDDIFDMATSIAKGKISQQQVGDKLQSITSKERQMWAQVAANIGQVLGTLTKGYDDTRFNEDITELERQIAEIKKFQLERASKENMVTETKLENTDDGTVSN